eukprot:CAMPEP_0170190914 /NCGR_PEP_ID=MMETSP0040_2-20121228/50442_1 /TAXON_ID=641309 /ORGANISM="Lotharella oceanica, Strain CCMP622" /LENGTH=40 /DNA_ID= /DNA_START= /DNA_END= /DNA_ORIENTATION=
MTSEMYAVTESASRPPWALQLAPCVAQYRSSPSVPSQAFW